MLVRPIPGRRLRPNRVQRHHGVCADCGTTTTIPFRPTQGRPIYCRLCFKARRNGPSSNAKAPVSRDPTAVKWSSCR